MATQREEFVDTVSHRRPERVLCHAGFTPDLRERVMAQVGTEDIAGHYGMFAPVHIGLRRPEEKPPLDFSRYWAGEDLPEGTTIDGNGVARAPAGFYHFWGYISPLRNATSLREIEEYPLEDRHDWDDSRMAAAVEAAHAEGRVARGGVGHMYEDAWQIRGYEQFLVDTVERPAWAECLLDRLAARNYRTAIACARAGVDLLHSGDDVANQRALMCAPDTWRRLMLSRWARVWTAVKEINPDCRIWYHSDGNIEPIVPELLDAGVDILNPLQPESLDIDEIHRRFGDRCSFDGCIGTQTTMPFGSPDDVRARVREVIERYGRNGGLIVSPTHVLEPEVPLENIDAFFDACREYGASP